MQSRAPTNVSSERIPGALRHPVHNSHVHHLPAPEQLLLLPHPALLCVTRGMRRIRHCRVGDITYSRLWGPQPMDGSKILQVDNVVDDRCGVCDSGRGTLEDAAGCVYWESPDVRSTRGWRAKISRASGLQEGREDELTRCVENLMS